MTVAEARKYLTPEDNKRLSDADVQKLLAEDYALADIAIDEVLTNGNLYKNLKAEKNKNNGKNSKNSAT